MNHAFSRNSWTSFQGAGQRSVAYKVPKIVATVMIVALPVVVIPLILAGIADIYSRCYSKRPLSRGRFLALFTPLYILLLAYSGIGNLVPQNKIQVEGESSSEMSSRQKGETRQVSTEIQEEASTLADSSVDMSRLLQRIMGNVDARSMATGLDSPVSSAPETSASPSVRPSLPPNSDFRRVRLPEGFEFEIPKNWRMLGIFENAIIHREAQNVLDLADIDEDLSQRVILFAANSMPRNTYAMVRVELSRQQIMTEKQAQSLTESEVRALGSEMLPELRSGLAKMGIKVLDYYRINTLLQVQ